MFSTVPRIANIFIETLRKGYLIKHAETDFGIVTWMTFVVSPKIHEALDNFLENLNRQQNQDFRFTIENEENNYLPLLDVLVRHDSGKLALFFRENAYCNTPSLYTTDGVL